MSSRSFGTNISAANPIMQYTTSVAVPVPKIFDSTLVSQIARTAQFRQPTITRKSQRGSRRLMYVIATPFDDSESVCAIRHEVTRPSRAVTAATGCAWAKPGEGEGPTDPIA